MAGTLQKPPAFRSLSAQIRYTEQRLDERRQVLRLHASALAEQLRSEIRQPPTLLFGAGIGFIMGELTRPGRVVKASAKNPAPSIKTATPLQNALNFVTLAQTLSSAWPVIWMTRAGQPKPAAGARPNPLQPVPSVAPASVKPNPAGTGL
jgi:hypothetical protein